LPDGPTRCRIDGRWGLKLSSRFTLVLLVVCASHLPSPGGGDAGSH